jgi:hypothetical protein
VGPSAVAAERSTPRRGGDVGFGTVRQVTDDFLLNMAEVSATLIGLFLVGVFFYVETGVGRQELSRRVFGPYLRAGTRITLIVFAIPLGLSLTLVVLEPIWSRVLFALLSLLLIAANIDSAMRVRGLAKGSVGLVVNEIVTTALAVVLVILPWVLGGLRPSREDLTWAILLSFAAGFLSIAATVMSAFDVARSQTVDPAGEDPGAG